MHTHYANTNANRIACNRCEQDRLQQMDDLLEAFIDEVWDSETCLLNAIENAPSTDMPISDAVELEARRMLDQMMRERDV